MAIPLTPQQESYVDEMSARFQAFKQSLIQALKADNDPLHNSGDARARAQALYEASLRLLPSLAASNSGGQMVHADTGVYLTRVAHAEPGFGPLGPLHVNPQLNGATLPRL